MRYLLFGLAAITLMMSTAISRAADERPTFTKSGHTTDGLPQVRQRVHEGKAVLLDVREPEEWNAGHLRKAQLLPLSVIREGRLSEEQKKLLPKDKPVYCHCRSGGRVLVVSRLLREQGYDIRPLKSGYTDLVKAGFARAESRD